MAGVLGIKLFYLEFCVCFENIVSLAALIIPAHHPAEIPAVILVHRTNDAMVMLTK